MTALIAPALASSFEGLIFFVYDREAVKKEADPPENAIVYFYPPSASIEDRISVCGQLIGMSHFMHGFIGARPALCKLQTEKVATVHSGKYTMALGGGLSEPDSLLIRQLETLHSIFTFYHGSLERIRLMCKSQNIFLMWMNVIWDCYLHFVRHYGDFLPGVFDPLPFLDLPKSVAATCFTKASYILQACQRRKHILGGCILYSNSVLCTQLEPSITETLLLLKPNQSHHPARPVKTESDLPFGVRILNAFLTLSEYLNIYDALAQSAYRQPSASESSGTFPDLYVTPSSSASNRESSSRQTDASDDKHLSTNVQQVSSDTSGDTGKRLSSTLPEGNSGTVGNSAGEVASSEPEDTTDGDESLSSTVLEGSSGTVENSAEEVASSEQVDTTDGAKNQDDEGLSYTVLEGDSITVENAAGEVASSQPEDTTEGAKIQGDEGHSSTVLEGSSGAVENSAEQLACSKQVDTTEGAKIQDVGGQSSTVLGGSSGTVENSAGEVASSEHVDITEGATIQGDEGLSSTVLEGDSGTVENSGGEVGERKPFDTIEDAKIQGDQGLSFTYLEGSSGTVENSGGEVGERKPFDTTEGAKIQGDEGLSSTVLEGSSGTVENSAEELACFEQVDTTEGAKIQDNKQHTNGVSKPVDQQLPESQSETESNSTHTVKPCSVEHNDEQDFDSVKTTEEEIETVVNEVDERTESKICASTEKGEEEENADNNSDSVTDVIEVINSTAAYDSSCESGFSNDVSLTMEAIDVEGLNVIECLKDCASNQSHEQQMDKEKNEIKTTELCTDTLCNASNCKTSESPGNDDDAKICNLVLEDLVTKVVAMLEEEDSESEIKNSEGVVGFGACCQTCADAQKSRDFSSGDVKPCESKGDGCKVETNESLTNEDSSSVKHDAGMETAEFPVDIQETIPCISDSNNGDEAICRSSPKHTDVPEKGLPSEVTSSTDSTLRSEMIRTPIVCDSFAIRNLNVASEKVLEKSFACVDTCTDTEIEQSPADTPDSEVDSSASNANGNADTVDGLSVTASFISFESDSEIYVANGHEGVSSSEGVEEPVDDALEEVEEDEEDESPEWFEPPLGLSSSLPDLEGEEQLLFEEEGGREDVNQVEGLTHVNLYVQAHSKIVLILLAEEGLNSDSNSLKALWETSLNQLGELEFLVKQSLGDECMLAHSDEYSFLVYDSFERNMKGNLDELVYQVDHSFCETTKVLHEQFENCSTLRDVTLRSRSSTVHGKRSLGRGTYFHLKGSYKTMHGVPSLRDPVLTLERRAAKVLHKEHGVNVF